MYADVLHNLFHCHHQAVHILQGKMNLKSIWSVQNLSDQFIIFLISSKSIWSAQNLFDQSKIYLISSKPIWSVQNLTDQFKIYLISSKSVGKCFRNFVICPWSLRFVHNLHELSIIFIIGPQSSWIVFNLHTLYTIFMNCL